MITAVELGFAKPDPRAFHAACHALQVAPRDAVYVGDDYELDFLAASAAGMQAIHLDRGRPGNPGLPRASLAQITATIRAAT